MSIPCEQEKNIIHISETLARLERGFDKLVELLQAVSKQDARIAHLETEASKAYTDLNELFGRVRTLEIRDAAADPARKLELHTSIEDLNQKLDKLLMYFNIVTHKYMLIAYVVVLVLILVGAVIDVTYHKETFNTLMGWFK